MAKKQPDLTNIFAKTEPAPGSSEPDPVRPVGIGLKASEWADLELMAA